MPPAAFAAPVPASAFAGRAVPPAAFAAPVPASAFVGRAVPPTAFAAPALIAPPYAGPVYATQISPYDYPAAIFGPGTQPPPKPPEVPAWFDASTARVELPPGNMPGRLPLLVDSGGAVAAFALAGRGPGLVVAFARPGERPEQSLVLDEHPAVAQYLSYHLMAGLQATLPLPQAAPYPWPG
jgi:hypothetical protein